MSHLPWHCCIASAHLGSNVAQVTAFYCSNHPKADKAYFFEACNNEEGVGVVFPNFIVSWLLLCKTKKYLNWQRHHQYFQLQRSAIKGVAVNSAEILSVGS